MWAMPTRQLAPAGQPAERGKIEAFRQKLWVDYGAFGENLVVEGFDLATLPVPSFFAIGDAVLEMTQIGKECHSDCAIRQQTGDCIMPREGVFARVVKGGTIHTGNEMKLLPTPADLPLRAAVITLSDKGSRGEREDKSGPLIVEMLTATGYKVRKRCFCRTMPPSSKPSCCALRMPVR